MVSKYSGVENVVLKQLLINCGKFRSSVSLSCSSKTWGSEGIWDSVLDRIRGIRPNEVVV